MPEQQPSEWWWINLVDGNPEPVRREEIAPRAWFHYDAGGRRIAVEVLAECRLLHVCSTTPVTGSSR